MTDANSQELQIKSNKNVQLDIDMIDRWYHEKVEGTVRVLDVQQDSEYKLYVHVKGYEKYEQLDTSNNSEDNWILIDEEEVINEEVSLTKENQESTDTLDRYIFSHELPGGIPGSFHHETLHYGKKVRCSVSYFITVHFENNEESASTSTTSPITVHRNFLVLESVKDREVKPCTAAKRAPISSSKGAPVEGDIRMELNIERDVFFPGDKIQIHSDIVNESPKHHIDQIVVKLVQNVTIRSRTTSLTQLVGEIERHSYDGIYCMEEDIRNIPFWIPEKVTQQTSGNLIKCDYRLIVKCELLLMTVTDMSLSLPITIVHEQPLVLPEPVPILPKKLDSPKSFLNEEASLWTHNEAIGVADEDELINEQLLGGSVESDYHKKISLASKNKSYSRFEDAQSADDICCIIC